jgi:hypothetical protein
MTTTHGSGPHYESVRSSGVKAPCVWVGRDRAPSWPDHDTPPKRPLLRAVLRDVNPMITRLISVSGPIAPEVRGGP